MNLGGDITQTYWVVQVNGKTVTRKLSSKFLAEAEIPHLTPEERQSAVVVPVTADGQQLLFE